MGLDREYIFDCRMRPVNCSQFFTLVTCEIGAGVAQAVQCLATDWTTGRSRFDPRQGQGFFL
jgi:hypothetical protein